MLREEIEYMTRSYRGLKAAQADCYRDGKDARGDWWGSKASVYRNVMRDLGYFWRHNEFTEIFKAEVIKPAKDFDQIRIELSLKLEKAPQVEAEELENFIPSVRE